MTALPNSTRAPRANGPSGADCVYGNSHDPNYATESEPTHRDGAR